MGHGDIPAGTHCRKSGLRQTSLVQEWGMASNGTRLVTDGALGMTACGRELELRHATSSSHITFNCKEGC